MEPGKLRLSGNGLRAQAGWCGSLADSLAGNNPPSGMGSSSLASWAATSFRDEKAVMLLRSIQRKTASHGSGMGSLIPDNLRRDR
jgi:hypothetical protein